MRRIGGIIIIIGLWLGVAPPSSAYTHFGSTNNTSLSIQWSEATMTEHQPDTAIIVRTDSFADSLAAGALAARATSPILMNPPDGGLHPAISNELARLGVDNVKVIGGTAAVSAQTAADLEAEGYAVERLAGTNRIETAVAVMQGAYDGNLFSDADSVVLVRGFGDDVDPTRGFADSLGAGVLAGSLVAPLLVTATDALSPETRAAIESMEAVATVAIAGGTGAVSAAVEAELVGMGLTVTRFAGADRAETAAILARRTFNPNGRRHVALVDGHAANSWASGFASAAVRDGAVLVSEGAALPTATSDVLAELRRDRNGGELFCAPEVHHDACLAAESLLNG